MLPADPDSFRHDTSSCRGRSPKLFTYRYIRPGISECLPVVLLENSHILRWRHYRANAFFGWLSESSVIIGDTIEKILDQIDVLEKNFVRIFTSDQRLLSKSACFEAAPNGSTLPWIKPIPALFGKTRLLSIVASRKEQTEGHRLRDEVIRKYQPLDVFGQGRREIRDKKDALWPYYFSVAVENASYPGYFTEKITDCFAAKTVPIYWGDPEIGRNFNEQGILWFKETQREDLTTDLYRKLLPFIQDNFARTTQLGLPDDIIFQKIQIHLQVGKRRS